jgi:predicted fused transcriptional regulator/phosphomethylpyrimidine kinase
MAKVLLAARSIDPSITSALNLRHDSKMQRVLNQLKVEHVVNAPRRKDRQVSDESIVESMKLNLQKLGRVTPCIVDTGGYGIEPILYLFDRSAEGAVKLALKLANEYVLR